jgi:hypothetical protein
LLHQLFMLFFLLLNSSHSPFFEILIGTAGRAGVAPQSKACYHPRMVELDETDRKVVARLAERFETIDQAMECYLTSRVSAFDGATPQDIVKAGSEERLWTYIAAVDAGVYA